MGWNVYLAGEIHSDWREWIAEGAREVDDIESEAAELSQNGVTFERYEGFDQDDKGIATMGPDKVAWLRDPDGNTLGVWQQG
jgi:hypothetical protein